MNERLVEAILVGVVPTLKKCVAAAVASATIPLIARISELEAKSQSGDFAPLIEAEVSRRVAELPPAEPGKSITADDVRPMLQGMVDALPKAEPGVPGQSVTVDDVAPFIEAEVSRRVAELPPAAPGTPGKSVTVDDVRPLIEGAIAEIKADTAMVPDELAENISDAVRMMAESKPAVQSDAASRDGSKTFRFERDQNNRIIAVHQEVGDEA